MGLYDNANKDHYGNTKWKGSTETQRSGVKELLDTKLDPPRILSTFPFCKILKRSRSMTHKSLQKFNQATKKSDLP